MEFPIHKAKTCLSKLVKILKSGERAVILEDEEPVAELMCWQSRGGIDFEKLESARERLGISGNREGWPEGFDDPKFSRQVLGLE